MGSTGSITFLFVAISNGIGAGCGVITSQYFGAQDDKAVRKAIANSAYIMIAAAAVMGLSAFLCSPLLLGLIGTPEDILQDAISYMRINCIGVPLVAVYNYASSMLRSLGDSKTPLYFLIISCILNIILDLICVCVLKAGVRGAAVATIIAQVVAGIGCLYYAIHTSPYFKIAPDELKADRVIMTRSIRIGLPLAFQWSLISLSTTALQAFVNSFGTAAVAAFTATNRIESLLHQPYGSLSAALSTYAGQNVGAGKTERVRLGVRDGVKAAAVFSAVMLILIQLLSTQIISVFVEDAEVISIGGAALRITSWFYMFLGVIYVTRGALNGVGDALFSLINGIVEVASRVALPMLLVTFTAIGVWGIWWTTCLTWGISALFCCMRYFGWFRKQKKNGLMTEITRE